MPGEERRPHAIVIRDARSRTQGLGASHAVTGGASDVDRNVGPCDITAPVLPYPNAIPARAA
jgi:hypothetical protein